MKPIVFIALLSLWIRPMQAQVKNPYAKFKSGKFIYDVKGSNAVIIRTKRTQTEIMNGGKSKIKGKITWVNDSTYILTCKKIVNAPGCLKKGDWIKATIIRVDGDKYECSFTSEKCGSGKTVLIKIE